VDLVPDAADVPREARSRTGFSLSRIFAHGLEPRQAEACPTKEVRS
jgi:hypothetical protein